MDAYQFSMKNADTNEDVLFLVSSETCVIDDNRWIRSFDMYTGDDKNREPHFVHYVLTHDKSPYHISNINKVFNSVRIAGRTVEGYVKGANELSAVRKGPKPMLISGLKMAGKGFSIGILITAAGTVANHVLHGVVNAISTSKPLYYVSPSGGPVFIGAVALSKGATVISA